MMSQLFDSDLYRLHPSFIAAFAEFILSLFIFSYFLSLKGKTKDTWMMVGFIGILMSTYFVDLAVTSSSPPIYSIFRVIHLSLFSIWMLYWIWVAYNYRGKPWPREGVFAIIIAGVLVVAILIDDIIYQLPKIGANFFFKTISFHTVVIFWVFVVLLRRFYFLKKALVRANEKDGDNSSNYIDHKVTAIRAFAVLSICWFFLLLITKSPITYHSGQMILLLGIMMIHISFTQEITSIQVKLVILPLSAILVILGIMPFILFGTSSPESTWGESNLELQQKLSLFVWIIPSSAIFILVAFFLFYRIGILKPLSLLMNGVQHIEKGDLNVKVPIFNRDEIGSLAKNVNEMAFSLKLSKEELENKVLERTFQLQESINQLKSTQAQLIQSEKMASLGELTAGIAHEIQNPLNFVNNFSEVSAELLDEVKETRTKSQETRPRTEEDEIEDEILEDIKKNLEKINHHGKRADAIVKGMLEHSRTSTGEKAPTDLNALAEEYVRLSYHGFRAKDKSFNADYKLDLDPNLPKVNVVASDIGRVILNLVNNAFYAVHEKSKSTPQPSRNIGTGSQGGAVLAPTVILKTTTVKSPSGDLGVEISVKDNGNGIPDSIKEKIFQPFFTTKPTGSGTGLGLSLSYDIVKAHGGELRVESSEGEYTTITIILPAK
ncbi:His Kinase A (phospho-acceptor) domain-containing protein [Aquiflexum balticum DSM 16537]|uniref:histidine kinase n=1 Tax=Aquiflexum balticum DSM 16537 TaxID=758820 RepID=A0A1W2H2V1_9BACT|nr:ATP-binding protein [Aquiflexum balticum]SMD42816.1 His Kinase A (phospho-acceptor) domain-containing protein [Aquiflexum balticum DSM 16537]